MAPSSFCLIASFSEAIFCAFSRTLLITSGDEAKSSRFCGRLAPAPPAELMFME